MTGQSPASWYPDPFSRYEMRYWDGIQWTPHVASRGIQAFDPPVYGPSASATAEDAAQNASWADPGGSRLQAAPANRTRKKIQRQVHKFGVGTVTNGPDQRLFTEPVLVVNQKGKLVELRAEYAIYDQQGQQLAAVRGQLMSKRLQVVDPAGRQLLELRREASFLKSKMVVAGPTGATIGKIVPTFHFRNPDQDFKLESANQLVGSIYGEDRRDPGQRHRHRYFNVQDATGNEVARVSKTWGGLAKELFTKGDNYVVNILGPLDDPLRSLAIAAALVVDTWYHQQ